MSKTKKAILGAFALIFVLNVVSTLLDKRFAPIESQLAAQSQDQMRPSPNVQTEIEALRAEVKELKEKLQLLEECARVSAQARSVYIQSELEALNQFAQSTSPKPAH